MAKERGGHGQRVLFLLGPMGHIGPVGPVGEGVVRWARGFLVFCPFEEADYGTVDGCEGGGGEVEVSGAGVGQDGGVRGIVEDYTGGLAEAG